MNPIFYAILSIGAGGALGAISRYLVAQGIGGFNPDLPKFVPTLTANVLGCFLIGVFVAVGRHYQMTGSPALLFLVTGFCGGFTTFSTFTLEFYDALMAGSYRIALLYALSSILIGLFALVLGIRLAKLFIN